MDQLAKKIKDYCAYTSLAVNYFRKKNYSDSALNCRKAAEAACKVMIFHAYSEKLAEKKIFERSLRELIDLVKKDKVSERKAINNIEALQITGNKAAHDNVISREESAYALNALNLLTNYLFKENLKIPIPAIADLDEDPDKGTTKDEGRDKIIIREKVIEQRIDLEAGEELFNRIRDLSESERNKYEEMFNLKYRALQEEMQRMNHERTGKDKVPPVAENEIVLAAAPKRGRFRKALLPASAAFVALLAFIAFLQLRPSQTDLLLQLNKHPDTVYVALVQFQVLQDNPQVEYRIREVLGSYIHSRTTSYGVPVSLRELELPANLQGDDTTINTVARLGYDVVFFGNLFENARNDSNILEIKGILSESRGFYRNKTVRFRNLSDSTFIREINDQANIPACFYTMKNQGKLPHQQLAGLLSELTTYSDENFLAVNDLISGYLYLARDYKTVLPLLTRLISLRPYGKYFLHRKANVLCGLGEFDSAGKYFDAALALDSLNPVFLFDYGDFKLINGYKEEAKAVYGKALQHDPAFELAAKRLNQLNDPSYRPPTPDDLKNQAYSETYNKGHALYNQKRYTEALEVLQRVYLERPEYPGLKALMASCYLFSGDNLRGLDFGRQIFLEDSLDPMTASLYAVILYKCGLVAPQTVEHYFNYAAERDQENTTLYDQYSDFLYAINDFKKCASISEKIWRKQPDHLKSVRYLADCYMKTKEYKKAIPHYEYLNLMAPNDTNYVVLAQCYAWSSRKPGPEHIKGVKLLRKAIDMNPSNSLAYLVLARYLILLGQINDAWPYYAEAIKRDAQNTDPGLEKIFREAKLIR